MLDVLETREACPLVPSLPWLESAPRGSSRGYAASVSDMPNSGFPLVLLGMTCWGNAHSRKGACNFRVVAGLLACSVLYLPACLPSSLPLTCAPQSAEPMHEVHMDLFDDQAPGGTEGTILMQIEYKDGLTLQGGICRDGFGPEEARVACRHMGLTGGRLLPGQPTSEEPIGNILMSHVQCKGNEGRLENCTYRTGRHALCPSNKQVAMACDGEHGAGPHSSSVPMYPNGSGPPAHLKLCMHIACTNVYSK